MQRNAALQCVGLWMILSSAAGRLTEEEQSIIVNMHNQIRSQVDPTAEFMQKVEWDEALRVVAEAYASKCIWKHNPEIKELRLGENLFTGTGAFHVTTAMQDWFKEHENYDYENNTCAEDQMCGHYTQMVWAYSIKIGCETHSCETLEGLDFEKSTLLVCNYFPGGNIKGKKPYVSGKPCSNCHESIPVCEDNICVADDFFPSVEPTSEDHQLPTTSIKPTTELILTELTQTGSAEATHGSRRIVEPRMEEDEMMTDGSEIERVSALLLLVSWLMGTLIL